MVNLKYSPVDVKDKIVHLLPELSFFQPYVDGTFDNDPSKGHIVVGVRTPWYDIVYVEVMSGSFWQNYVSEAGLKSIIAEVSGDLDAAVSIQTEFGQGEAMRLDKSELAEYLKDPDSYIKNRRENNLSKPTYKLPRIYPTVYSKGDRTQGGVTVYVNHDNVWTDQTLVEASVVTFLCKCTKCRRHFEHILELRREKQYHV